MSNNLIIKNAWRQSELLGTKKRKNMTRKMGLLVKASFVFVMVVGVGVGFASAVTMDTLTVTGNAKISGLLSNPLAGKGLLLGDSVDMRGTLWNSKGAVVIGDLTDFQGALSSSTGAVMVGDDLDVHGALSRSYGPLKIADGIWQDSTEAVTLNGRVAMNGGFDAGKSKVTRLDVTDVLTASGGTDLYGAAVNLNRNSNNTTDINTGTSTGTVAIGGGYGAVFVDSADWDISSTGAMTGIGAVTMDGVLTGTAGANVSGAQVNLNKNSNNVTDINTGTSTGTVAIGGGLGAVAVDSSTWDVTGAGNMSGVGTFGMSGLLTGTGGATVTGAAVNLNADSNFATNLNTGTSSGAVTIGGGSGTVAVNSSDWDISTTGVMTGIGAITSDGLFTGTAGATVTGAAVNLNASSNFGVNLATGTSTGTVTLGGAAAQTIAIGSGAGGKTITIGTDNTNADTITVGSALDTIAVAGSTLDINTGDWDISTTGVMTGIGAITADGLANFTGSMDIGDAATDTVTITADVDSNVIPSAGTETLGDGTTRWASLFVGTVNFATAITDANSGNTTTTIGDSSSLDSLTVTANTAITDAQWGITAAGAISTASTIATTATNAAGGSANPIDVTSTLEIMDGSDTFEALDINLTNANHTGSNTVRGIDIATITGDAEATESAIFIGDGWDAGISGATYTVDGTTALTLGGGTGTVAVNSSDWDIDATGAMTGIGAITSNGLFTGSAGATVTGAAVSLNASSNFAVNIATGTSTGAVTIGGTAGNVIAIGADNTTADTITVGSALDTVAVAGSTLDINTGDWDISTTGAMTGIGAITSNGVFTTSSANAAGGSSSGVNVISTLGIMDGSDDFSAVNIDLANANHTGASNTVYGLTIDGITGDADATETAIDIGDGWDVGISGGTYTIDGTTALTIGTGVGTIAINSSDWDIDATGIMTGIGAITSNGLFTGTAGATVTGAAVSLNASSNFAVNIATGTSTGTVTIGGTAGNTIAIGTDNTIADTIGIGSALDTLNIAGTVNMVSDVYVENKFRLGSQPLTTDAAADTVDVGAAYIEVTFGTAGDDISLTTTGAAEGDVVIIANVGANTGQLDADGANMRVTGNADADLTQYDATPFIFNGTDWLQVSAVNDNS